MVGVIGEQRRVRCGAGHTHATQIVEGVLPRVIPAHDTGALGGCAEAADVAVGGHDLRR